MCFFRVFLYKRFKSFGIGFKHLYRSSTLSRTRIQKETPKKISSYEFQPPQKFKKRTLFIKSKNHKKCTKNIFFSNLNVFEYNRFIELVCCKKYFLFLIFCPLEFFENLTLRTSHWFLEKKKFSSTF